jgi:hypothetical protein
MIDELNLDPGQQKQLAELQLRHNLCRFCIKTVSEVDPNDPRRPGALAEYNRQLAEIDAKIAKITGKPPAIVIGLKPGVISSKAGGLKT